MKAADIAAVDAGAVSGAASSSGARRSRRLLRYTRLLRGPCPLRPVAADMSKGEASPDWMVALDAAMAVAAGAAHYATQADSTDPGYVTSLDWSDADSTDAD
jgi:hypothetical protein